MNTEILQEELLRDSTSVHQYICPIEGSEIVFSLYIYIYIKYIYIY